MNRLLIQSLAPAFLASGKLDSVPNERIEKSLSLESAKVWLAEIEKHICNECYGEWRYPQNDKAEVLNGRWEKIQSPCGRKAPFFSKIRVFGGFLSREEVEYIPPGKEHRAEDIRDTGWS